MKRLLLAGLIGLELPRLALAQGPAWPSGASATAANATSQALADIITQATGVAAASPLWAPQLHQNVGGNCYQHAVCFGDQNMDLVADRMTVQSRDPSILGHMLVGNPGATGQTMTNGDQAGIQWKIVGAAYSKYLTAASDTTTTFAKRLAAAINGGALSAAISSSGAGYTNNDTVTAVIPAAYHCSYMPQFTLTVSGGIVTAAAPQAVSGSNVQGGACDSNPMPSTVGVTGGTGSGLLLSVKWGFTDLAHALAVNGDPNNFGSTATAYYAPMHGGMIGDFVVFDRPATTSLLTCGGASGDGSSCPAGATNLAFDDDSVDNGPYVAGVRQFAADPARPDQLTNYRIVGPSSAVSSWDTNYALVGGAVGDVANVIAHAGLSAQTCTVRSPCTLTVTGFAGTVPGVSTGANWLVTDVFKRQAIGSGTYISAIAANGGDTNLSIVGTVNAPGIKSGDPLSIIDSNNPVGTPYLAAATAASAKAAAIQLYFGGRLGGVWTPGVAGNSAGDGSTGTDHINALSFDINGLGMSGSAGGLTRTTGAALVSPALSGPSLSGAVGGSPTAAGNWTFQPMTGTPANFHGAPDGSPIAQFIGNAGVGGAGAEVIADSGKAGRPAHLLVRENGADIGSFGTTGRGGIGISRAGAGYGLLDDSSGTLTLGESSQIRMTAAGPPTLGLPLVLKNYTVDTLPAGVAGATAYVTDAVACTFLSPPVHHGTVTCPVFYNGTAWVAG